MHSLFGLAGAGGFGRTVMPLLRAACQPDETPCFIEKDQEQERINGTNCLSEAGFFSAPGKKYFNVAIADSVLREKIARNFIERSATPRSIFCPSVKIFDDVQIGDGAILCSHSMVTSNVRIGAFFHANIYSYVEHDCSIGDFVTFAPGVKCNGNVTIGNHCYIGSGAILRDGRAGKPLRIGDHAIVGMGAVVVEDVPAGAIVVGNPARPLARGRAYSQRNANPHSLLAGS